MKKNSILIAGGTGLIGRRLYNYFFEKGYNVSVLSRNPKESNEFYWNPDTNTIDIKALENVTHLLNVTGQSIADKRWTSDRKKELIDSRINPTNFLFKQVEHMPQLQHYISASGINCYGYENPSHTYSESDSYGGDFVSQLVEKWEKAADQFQSVCGVTKIRISPVLDEKGGIYSKMKKPIYLGLGTIIGTGDQPMSWIHRKDLVRLFEHVIKNNLFGTYHGAAGYVSNEEFTKTLANVLNRPIILPALNGAICHLIFGEMAEILLKGNKISIHKIEETGFDFLFPMLNQAMKHIATN